MFRIELKDIENTLGAHVAALCPNRLTYRSLIEVDILSFVVFCTDVRKRNTTIYCTQFAHTQDLYYMITGFKLVPLPHHGCHRWEWFLSTVQWECSSSGLTHTGWTLHGRRNSVSSQHETTDPWATSPHYRAGAELGTRCLREGVWGRREKVKCWMKTRVVLNDNSWTLESLFIYRIIKQKVIKNLKYYLCMLHVTPVYHCLISWVTTPHHHHRSYSWLGEGIAQYRSHKSAHFPAGLPVEETLCHVQS